MRSGAGPSDQAGLLLCALLACDRLGAATHIDAGAVAARNLRVDEPGDQHAPVERDDLAIARAGSGLVGRPDGVLAVGAALEAQFGLLRLIGELPAHAAPRPASDVVGLAALAAGRRFRASAVLILVIGRKTPAPDQIGRRNARG